MFEKEKKKSSEGAKKTVKEEKELNEIVSKNQGDLFNWVDKCIKNRRYAVHITVLIGDKLESVNLVTDLPLEDLVASARSYKAHIEKQVWR